MFWYICSSLNLVQKRFLIWIRMCIPGVIRSHFLSRIPSCEPKVWKGLPPWSRNSYSYTRANPEDPEFRVGIPTSRGRSSSSQLGIYDFQWQVERTESLTESLHVSPMLLLAILIHALLSLVSPAQAAVVGGAWGLWLTDPENRQ